ncbi:MAG: DUF1573 domain-containing protein [Muribaculaceae bacterium]|nr:DUF1573 domain-containing protein [Muribaculaceae bacterium]
MKKFFTTFIALFIATFSMLADGEGAKISFLEKSHDFGTIKEANGPVSYEFEFKNVGDEPLVILSARASCGCTKPEYPEKPIKPGEKGKIKITYNPAGRPGEFDRKVKIQTNDKSRRPVLKITGVVIPKNNGEEKL